MQATVLQPLLPTIPREECIIPAEGFLLSYVWQACSTTADEWYSQVKLSRSWKMWRQQWSKMPCAVGGTFAWAFTYFLCFKTAGYQTSGVTSTKKQKNYFIFVFKFEPGANWCNFRFKKVRQRPVSTKDGFIWLLWHKLQVSHRFSVLIFISFNKIIHEQPTKHFIQMAGCVETFFINLCKKKKKKKKDIYTHIHNAII